MKAAKLGTEPCETLKGRKSQNLNMKPDPAGCIPSPIMKARPVRTLEEDKAASERTSDNREPNRSHVGGRGGMLSLPLVRCDQPHMKPRDLTYKDDRLREHPRIARFPEDINALATDIGPRNVFHWNQL